MPYYCAELKEKNQLQYVDLVFEVPTIRCHNYYYKRNDTVSLCILVMEAHLKC